MVKKLPQFIAGFAAATGGFNSGTVLGWSSSGIPLIEKMREDKNEKLNEEVGSWIGGVMNIGAVISLILCAVLLDRMGRKWFMILTVPWYVMGWVLMAFIDADANFIVMRIVMGMAAGGFCVACPMYAAEIAATNVRGIMGVCFQMFLVCGILYSFLLGLTRSLVMLCLLNLIPVGVFCLWMLFMPQSPYFLLKRKKEEKARLALVWLRGAKENPEEVEEEFTNIKETVEHGETMKQATCKDIMRKRELRNAMGVAVLLMCCQQLSGINAVIFNMESIFTDAAGSGKALEPVLQAIIVGCVQVVATLLATLIVDVVGRRILMILSMALMGVFHFGLAAFFFVKELHGDKEAQRLAWLPILSLCGYIAAFSIGAGPLPWSMMGEIFPEESKSIAASAAGILNWLLSLLITKTYVNLKDKMTVAGTFMLYACICWAGMVLLFFFLPETRKREFEDIQAMFRGEKPEIAPIGFKRGGGAREPENTQD